MKTVQEQIADITAEFRKLSSSRQVALKREAREYIAKNPGCADHSNFWRGLSARQVLAVSAPAKAAKKEYVLIDGRYELREVSE